MESILRVRNANGDIIDIPVIKGKDGKSAYQSAVDGGYNGTEEEFNSLLANVGGPVERPTDTTDPVDLHGVIVLGNPFVGGFIVCNNWELLPEIPAGTEIKSIEFKIASDGDWVDIRDMHTVDGVPFILNMSKVYGTGSETTFAIVCAIENTTNYIYNAVDTNLDDCYARITYYTD